MTEINDTWFIRPQDVARLSGLSTSEIRNAIYRGELKAKSYRGISWLIEPDDARNWIDSQCISAEKAIDNAKKRSRERANHHSEEVTS